MAIGRISGVALAANLDRQGNDLTIGTGATPLVHFDATLLRVGIRTSTPQNDVEIVGNMLTSGSMFTTVTNTHDIGTGALRFNNVYTREATTDVITSTDVNTTNVAATTGTITTINSTTGEIVTVNSTDVNTSNVAATTGTITTINSTTGTITTINSTTGEIVTVNSTDVNTSNVAATLGTITTANINVLDVSSTGLISGTADSTTSLTGALQVVGGLGVAKRITTDSGATFNNVNADADFIVKGTTANSLILADASLNTVVIGGSAATATAGATLQVNGTDSFLLPVGTTAQRPGVSGATDVIGMFRFNSSISGIEIFDGSVWRSPNADYTVINSRQFALLAGDPNGNVDGANTDFTLASTSTAEGTIVAINGLLQTPVTDYSVAGATLTFVAAPAISEVVDTRVMITASNIVEISGTTSRGRIAATDNDIEIYSGTASSVLRASITGDGKLALVGGTGITYNQAAISVGTSAVIIDSFSAAVYRSAKYQVQVTNTTLTEYETAEILVVHDDSDAYLTTYGVLYSGAIDLGTFAVSYNAGTVELTFTGTVTNNFVKVLSSYIAI